MANARVRIVLRARPTSESRVYVHLHMYIRTLTHTYTHTYVAYISDVVNIFIWTVISFKNGTRSPKENACFEEMR